MKDGSSLALPSPGVDMLEDGENSSIVQWSLSRNGTMSFIQNLDDVRSALEWGSKEKRKSSFIYRIFTCSQSTFFCVNKDSAGAFMQERAGDRTASSGRGQCCHICDRHFTFHFPLNSICGDELIC